MRHFLSFACGGDTLAATLDLPTGAPRTGLLIVSGGNELRSGAHRGMALLADRLAGQGHAVFRFDRRGIGDSEGANLGFESSAADIAAALAAFRDHCPTLARIVAFGNCDAASALALHGPFVAIDALILANPWAIEDAADTDRASDDVALPSAAAIRARYLAKLKDPREWLRLLRGGVDLGKLARGLGKATGGDAPSGLAQRLGGALARLDIPVDILLATRDRTGIEFLSAWTGMADARGNSRITLHRLDSASHSFARADDGAWLERRLIAALGA